MASAILDSRRKTHSPRLPAFIEGGLVLAVCALGLFVFFGRAIESHFSIYPGELGDWRFNGFIAEHWFSVLKGQAEWRSPPIYYPVKGILGYSDSLFLFAPFYIPFRLAGVEPSLAFVFCFMSIVAFGFISSYWFMSRILRFQLPVALGASFVFIFSSIGVSHIGHAQLYACAFLPLLFACGVSFSGSILDRRPSLGAGSGFFVGLAAILYTGFYVGYFSILFVAIFFAVFLLLSIWRSDVAEILASIWRARTALVFCAITFGVALIPFVLTYLPTLKDVGGRDWGMVECMLPFPRDFINVGGNAAWHWLAEKFGPDTRPCAWELTFGLPLGTQIVFALSLISLLFAWRGAWQSSAADRTNRIASNEVQLRAAVSIAVAVVLCWLAMMRFDNGSLWHLLYSWVPGVTALRAVFRFQVVLNFFVAITIGFALSRISGMLSPKPALVAQTLIAAALAIEQYNPYQINFAGSAESTRLNSIEAPPPTCKQFFLDPEGANTRRSYVGMTDAVILAQRFRLPTLNGYSSGPPNGFYHTEFSDPLYLTKVAQWARDHNLIDGLCMLNLSRHTWQQISAIQESLESVLLNSNILTFNDPMAIFLFRFLNFRAAEQGGVWTKGNAEVQFFKPITNVRKVIITGHRGFDSQRLIITAGGNKVEVEPSMSVFRIEIETKHCISAIEIGTDSFVPVARGMGPDTRELGVLIESIILQGDQ